MWRVAALLAAAAHAAASRGGAERLDVDSLPPLPVVNISNATRPEDFEFRSGALEGSRATCAWSPLVAGGALNSVAVFGTSGGVRSFNIALPRGWDTGGPRTMLIAFHGGAHADAWALAKEAAETEHTCAGYIDSGGYMPATALPGKATRAGFVLVGPNAQVLGDYAVHHGPLDGPPDLTPWIDEVAFVGDVAACIGGAMGVPLDGRAVLQGYSLGAMLACQVACAPPPGLTITAVAVAGGVDTAPRGATSCVAAPLLLLQGDADTQVPLCDRAAQWGPFSYAPTWPKLRAWIAAMGGDPAVRTQTMCAGGPGGDVARLYNWPGSKGPTAMLWLPGGIHWWPPYVDGCPSSLNWHSTDYAIAFYRSALAGAPNPLPEQCAPGFAPCQRRFPCDPLLSA